MPDASSTKTSTRWLPENDLSRAATLSRMDWTVKNSDLKSFKSNAYPAHAEAIRVLARRTAADIVEIGERLIAVSKTIPHGAWLLWLSEEFNWSRQTADNYMQAAQAFVG